MRNRAKCKLCKSIIESFANIDYITCSCGEIAISGGQFKYECFAHDLTNIIRLDDHDNEIIPKIVDKEMLVEEENQAVKILYDEAVKEHNEKAKICKDELLEALDHMIKNIENLPENAKTLPINHYDFGALLLLLSAILRSN